MSDRKATGVGAPRVDAPRVKSEADAQSAAAAAALKAPKASTLTNAERLLIARRRKRERKDQAAKRWRVSLYEYQRWERGEAEPLTREQRSEQRRERRGDRLRSETLATKSTKSKSERGRELERVAPRVPIGALAFFEWAMVLRRRRGESVKRRADRMGVTPWWLSQMELGEAPDGALRKWMLTHEAGAVNAAASTAAEQD